MRHYSFTKTSMMALIYLSLTLGSACAVEDRDNPNEGMPPAQSPASQQNINPDGTQNDVNPLSAVHLGIAENQQRAIGTPTMTSSVFGFLKKNAVLLTVGSLVAGAHVYVYNELLTKNAYKCLENSNSSQEYFQQKYSQWEYAKERYPFYNGSSTDLCAWYLKMPGTQDNDQFANVPSVDLYDSEETQYNQEECDELSQSLDTSFYGQANFVVPPDFCSFPGQESARMIAAGAAAMFFSVCIETHMMNAWIESTISAFGTGAAKN